MSLAGGSSEDADLPITLLGGAGLAWGPFTFSVRLVASPVSRSPLVIAHSGASAELPENTLAAFRRALEVGVDGIELDVHTTADGVPVVFHDAALRRLTGRPGRVARKMFAELRLLRVARTDERIPTLREVLALVRSRGRGRVVVQIELKRGVAVAPVVAAVRAARATKSVILASFELPLVAEAARLAPRIPRMVISEGRGSPATLARQLAAVRAIGLSVNHAAVRDRALVDAIRGPVRAGSCRRFTLWTWTVNNPARMRKLAKLGVDAILTDAPALLRKTLSRKWGG